MFLVCAADDFSENIGKFGKLVFFFFLKINKKSVIIIISSVSRLDRFIITLTSIQLKKTALKTLICFKKLIFAFWNPKIVE